MIQDVIKNMIQCDPMLEIVGIASDGLEALNTISLMKPDLILLSTSMPDFIAVNIITQIIEIIKTPILLVHNSVTSRMADMIAQRMG